MDILKLNRIPTKHIVNFRSLGGYAAGDSHVTRHGVFYRSGWMSDASPSEIDIIKELGIKTVIDLRSAPELEKLPSNLSLDGEFNYKHIDLMSKLNPGELIKQISSKEDMEKFNLSDLYKYLVDNEQEGIYKIFEAIAENVEKGAVFYHCSAGKDRTGITSMFLLSIAEVKTLDIIANYEVSSTYIQSHGEGKMMGSAPQNMIEILFYLKEKYGSAVDYLKSIGVSQNQLDTIRNVFLE